MILKKSHIKLGFIKSFGMAQLEPLPKTTRMTATRELKTAQKQKKFNPKAQMQSDDT